MPDVVRFALDSERDLYVPGAGYFNAGILDVPVGNAALLTRVRYRVQPYGAVELGVTDETTPPPDLPAEGPGDVDPDPYPQYVTDVVAASYALRGEAAQNLTAALPNLMTAIRSYNDQTAATLRIIGAGSSVGVGATLPDTATQAPSARFFTRLGQTINKLGNLQLAHTNGSVNGSIVTDFNSTSYAAAKTTAGGTPTVVLLAFGMNDGMPAQYHAGQTYPGAYLAMRTAVRAVLADGGDPIIVTSPHPHTGRMAWNGAVTSTYPSATPVPALTSGASVVSADWAGTGVSIPASYRHLRVNQAFRRVAMEHGVPVIDAERYWFKAVATYGENALFNTGEFAHPNLLGHQQSYWLAIDDFMRGLITAPVSASTPPAVNEQFAVKNSNAAYTNSTTLTADSQLTFNVGINQVWMAEFDVFYTAPVAADLKMGVTFPTGCTGSLAVLGVAPAATTNSDVSAFRRTPLTAGASISAGGNTQDGWVKMRVLVRSGTTPGAVTFVGAQVVADPSASTVYADSMVRATRVS